eukprot:3525408-Rhodomonas_salina.1
MSATFPRPRTPQPTTPFPSTAQHQLTAVCTRATRVITGATRVCTRANTRVQTQGRGVQVWRGP